MAEHLRSHPEFGRVVPEIGQNSYREIIFQNYRIVYRLLDERVVIVGVVHAAMDLERQIEKRSWDLT